LIRRVAYQVHLTAGAHQDLDRLYDFLPEVDVHAAKRALDSIEEAFRLLAYSPFSCRKATLQQSPLWRELLIPFGHSGYIALFELEDNRTVTICAVRHQREEDYH
jgi:plasmid stabilization system protein ParE